MDDFPVAGPAESAEEALALLRATAIASFGEAVREIARQNFLYCSIHDRAVPLDDETRAANRQRSEPLPEPVGCVCPEDEAADGVDATSGGA